MAVHEEAAISRIIIRKAPSKPLYKQSIRDLMEKECLVLNVVFFIVLDSPDKCQEVEYEPSTNDGRRNMKKVLGCIAQDLTSTWWKGTMKVCSAIM